MYKLLISVVFFASCFGQAQVDWKLTIMVINSRLTAMRVLGLTQKLSWLRRISSSSRIIPSSVSKDDEILPVLIVGAGPVGLSLSILLTKLGIKCAILEKNTSFSRHPQAHFINNRSMEIFRKMDGLGDEIVSLQPPVDHWRKFVYCTSLTGQILGSVDHVQPQDFDGTVSPTSVAHFSQYKLNDLLIEKLRNLGFHVVSDGLIKEKEILMGHECISVNATDHGISVTTSFLREGRLMKKDIHCSFLVGADGARSSIRELVGIDMVGEKDLQKFVSIHFMSRDLGNYLMNERPGMLFFIFNAEAIGVLVAHDLEKGEFILQVPFYPPQQKLEDFSTKSCERFIFTLVGRELADINVKDVKSWVMHAEVAEKFMSHNNRILLAGDAAHRFPPAGGFGMNTGVQDAHNLAWKIASVLNGIVPASFLSTYETERKQIASYNTKLSVKNFKSAMRVPAALGLDPKIANAVHRAINDTVGTILPEKLQSSILDRIFSLGRFQVSDSVLNENNPLGSARLARLRQIFDDGNTLQLQFPAEDIGFRYLEGALVPDDCSSNLSASDNPSGRRRDYVPSADPGSRLPHMKIRWLSEQETFSTLDLVSLDKLEFLLIISPLEESFSLARAAFEVARELKVGMKTCVMWPDRTTFEVGKRTSEVLNPWTEFIEVVEVRDNPTAASWWDVCQMTNSGAILVRPDEHIAWRPKAGVSGDLVPEMRRVLSTVLGLQV